MNAVTNPNLLTSTPLPASWVEKLLHEMLLTYGKKFTDQWGSTSTDDLVAYWGAQLAGYSGAEIRHGLDALATKDWPPTLPEFKKLCRRPLDSTTAYYEAVAGVQARAAGEYGKWSHPAIYWAAMPLAFDLGNQTYSQIKPRWEAALFEQMDKGEWPEIPPPMVALPAPGKTKTTREEAAQRLRELHATGIVKDSAGNDPKRWARRILEREAAGEHVLPIQARFAREAIATP
ncbi:hypothetical protein [Massilia sp.]|uniref:hypothetical protein n=1 Tax=Massilia sp. TaxID=1882437 RepID=UPI00352F09AB